MYMIRSISISIDYGLKTLNIIMTTTKMLVHSVYFTVLYLNNADYDVVALLI